MRRISPSLASALVFTLAACGGGELPVEGGGGNGGTSNQGGNGGDPTNDGGSGAGIEDGGGPEGGGGAASNGGGGEGGEGGGVEPWPTCDMQPAGSPTKTLEQIWEDDPEFPTAAWVPGVYVTAISRGGCIAGQACQFFVQQEESFDSLDAAAHQSLRVGVAPSVAMYFTDIAVGDQVDLYAHAFRDAKDGNNELFFLVAQNLPGCAFTVGEGTLEPVDATLDDLTLATYEVTHGPLFIRLETVSGRPKTSMETFGLWHTGEEIGDDLTTVTSLSPFFLPNAAFPNTTENVITDFDFAVGVFAVFAPPADPLIKYEELYVRTVADYPLAN